MKGGGKMSNDNLIIVLVDSYQIINLLCEPVIDDLPFDYEIEKVQPALRDSCWLYIRVGRAYDAYCIGRIVTQIKRQTEDL